MVMSGSGERVVFVHARPGDEALLTGGTIARLCGDGSRTVVLYGPDAAAEPDGIGAALAALGGREWRRLPPTDDGDPERERLDQDTALDEALADVWATAVVIGAVDDRLRLAATRAAHAAGVPVFLARRVSDAGGQRLIAIDVSDHLDQKLHALALYPDRWSIEDHELTLPDGTHVTVGGSESYVRSDAPHSAPAPPVPPTLAGRVVGAVLALCVGVAFGVLGTVAHQGTLRLGPLVLPVGLVVSLVAASALLVGLRLVVGDRLVVLSCAVGLLGTIFVLSLRGVGGSVLVPAGLPGLLWTVVPAFVAALVLAWPKIPVKRG